MKSVPPSIWPTYISDILHIVEFNGVHFAIQNE